MHNSTIIYALTNGNFGFQGSSNQPEIPLINSNSIHSNTRLKGNPHSRRPRAPNEEQRRKIAIQLQCDKLNYETTPSKISFKNGKVDEINMKYDATSSGLSCKDIIEYCALKGFQSCIETFVRSHRFEFYNTKKTITFYETKENKRNRANALHDYSNVKEFQEYAPIGATSVIEGIKYKKHEDGGIASEINKKNDRRFCNIL